MKGLLIIISLCFVFDIHGQSFSNDWIREDQEYFKIKIGQKAIYRITYDDLIAVGANLANVNPGRVMLFHRGIEQGIFYSGGITDLSFDPGDYLEFLGLRNDGTLDKRLYSPPEAQPHNYYNLYSDTTAYFLTWSKTVDGKRMQENPALFNVDNLPAEPFHFEEVILVFSSDYSKGLTPNFYTNLTEFDFGEGWTGPIMVEGNASTNHKDFVLEAPDIFNNPNDKPILEIVLAGRSNLTHNLEIQVGPDVSGKRILKTDQFDDYLNRKIKETLEWTDFSPTGTLNVSVVLQNNDDEKNSQISVSLVKLTYPQTIDMAGFSTGELLLKETPADISFLKVPNVPGQMDLYDITDPNTVSRLGVIQAGNEISTLINGTSTKRRLFLKSAPTNVPNISKVTFRKFNPQGKDYIIISHPTLMKPAGGYNDAVDAYASYRASVAGGAHNTLVADINQLYDQFSFGELTSQAIYNFMDFIVARGDPEHLFIIGKGLNIGLNYYRRNPSEFVYHNLVPPAGSPGADMTYTAGLKGTRIEPAVPTGRLTASTPQQIINYLDKVKETEALPFDNLWRKNVLHLSGGNSLSELRNFRLHLDGFKSISEDTYLGGKTTTVQKQSQETVEFINVSRIINEGVNLVTFFGHSAPSIIDIDIGFVTAEENGYNNQGKYPVFLMNGCDAGAVYNHNLIFGEDWMLAANRGGIGFIAHSSFGFSPQLRTYSNLFYSVAYGDSLFIGKSIAKVQQEVSKRYQSILPTPRYKEIAQMQQMVFMGDPALVLFGATAPDYQTSDGDIFIEPLDGNPITALSNSFKMSFIVRNFGRVNNDSLTVVIKRTLNNGQELSMAYKLPTVLYQDTLSVVVDNDIENSFGNNKFEVIIDSDFKVSELNETNNSALFNFFIPLNAPFNLFPLNFGIENTKKVTLKSQTANTILGPRDFVFELDTSANFNSPVRIETTIGNKVLAEWQVDLLDNDSMVYYWRVKFSNPKPGESSDFTQSSFLYINSGPEGWAQSHFPQFASNELNGLIANDISRNWDFRETELTYSVTTYGANDLNHSYTDILFKYDEFPFISSEMDPTRRCANNSIATLTIDKSSLSPYRVLGQTCGSFTRLVNTITNGMILDPSDFIAQFVDGVKDGDKVILFSIGSVAFESLSANQINKLGELGASATVLNSLINGQPYILIGTKGSVPGTAIEFSGSDVDEINAQGTLKGVFSSGSITSPVIGPAQSWAAMFRKADIFNNDQVNIDVIGIEANGNESVLANQIIDNTYDLSGIDNTLYPKIKLRANLEDTTDLTAPKMNSWIVTYEPTVEGLLFFSNNDDQGTLNLDKQEGQSFTTQFGYVNISDKPYTDSLELSYTIKNKSNSIVNTTSRKISPPLPGDTTIINIEIDTRGLVGLNNLRVDVTPWETHEQYVINNTIELVDYFNVNRDETNPVIDVVFDGEYILDGDIVSPNPLISIRLKDENQYLFKDDTTQVTVLMKADCETCSFDRIDFSSPDIVWTPATVTSDYTVEFQPRQLTDAKYTLRVQASDESGNLAGVQPYEIRFQVVNESQISNFFTYPNPFSSSTRFVFTLTGAIIPEFIKIQIMTVSGKIVREITQDELGPIRIGNNISDFAWDGTDEFGGKLANGVYLYRVFISSNGNEIPLRPTLADKAFQKGFGKIYLLR